MSNIIDVYPEREEKDGFISFLQKFSTVLTIVGILMLGVCYPAFGKFLVFLFPLLLVYLSYRYPVLLLNIFLVLSWGFGYIMYKPLIREMTIAYNGNSIGDTFSFLFMLFLIIGLGIVCIIGTYYSIAFMIFYLMTDKPKNSSDYLDSIEQRSAQWKRREEEKNQRKIENYRQKEEEKNQRKIEKNQKKIEKYRRNIENGYEPEVVEEMVSACAKTTGWERFKADCKLHPTAVAEPKWLQKLNAHNLKVKEKKEEKKARWRTYSLPKKIFMLIKKILLTTFVVLFSLTFLLILFASIS